MHFVYHVHHKKTIILNGNYEQLHVQIQIKQQVNY